MAKRQKPGLRQRQEAPGLCFLGALIPLPAPGTEGSLDFGPLRIHCPPVCAAGQDHLVSNVLEHIDIRVRITAHPMGPAPPLVKIDAVPACHFPPQLLLRIRSDLRRLCQSHILLRAAGEEMQPNIDKNRSERRAGRDGKAALFPLVSPPLSRRLYPDRRGISPYVPVFTREKERTAVFLSENGCPRRMVCNGFTRMKAPT